tara:strand:- start:6219 stop:6599 length:381 start_codon:yes stop_codon:yes gene_type:complete
MLRFLQAIIIGSLIPFISILPPIIHFFTGPIGPFIGGLIAGTMTKSDPLKAIILSLGITISVFMYFILAIVIFGQSLSIVPDDFSLGGIMISSILFIYILGLTLLGSIIGGYTTHKKLKETGSNNV